MFEEFFEAAFETAPVGMLIVDPQGTIVSANREVERLFRFARWDLLGRPVEVLIGGARSSHRALRERFHQAPGPRPMGHGRDLVGLRRDGVQVSVEVGLTPLPNPDGTYVLATLLDLTERRRTQDSLELLVREKEVLLKEVQHRTKNDLQLILSLLDMVGEDASEALRTCRARIDTIATVHDLLHRAGTEMRFDLNEHLRAVAQQFSAPNGGSGTVAVRVEGLGVWLGPEQAVPCSLIVNELVTNSAKHAFPAGRVGAITLRASQSGDEIRIDVVDDGVGGSFEARPGHVGLDLVRALTRQLRGALTSESGPGGTQVRLTFPLRPPSEGTR